MRYRWKLCNSNGDVSFELSTVGGRSSADDGGSRGAAGPAGLLPHGLRVEQELEVGVELWTFHLHPHTLPLLILIPLQGQGGQGEPSSECVSSSHTSSGHRGFSVRHGTIRYARGIRIIRYG